MPPLILSDLRGGLNDTPSVSDVGRGQCVVSQNMDYDAAPLGGKRAGTHPRSNGYAGNATAITFLFRHTPSNNETETELWAAGPTAGSGALDYRDATGWHAAGFTPDGLLVASGAYDLDMISLHGKLFVAYPAASGGALVDRLHVRRTDSGVTTLRRAGLPEPAAPAAANSGSGSYAGVRYARVRYTEQVAGVTVRRSEPSDVTTHTPSGSPSGMQITRPALLGEHETHWEVELSIDNVNFYRVTTLAIATGTYTDTVAYATGYAASGTLSDDIGDYTLLYSPKYLSADEDRLLMAGAWVNAEYKSRIAWTPVALAPGVGNDERLESDTDPFLDLDGYDGGEITGFKGPVNGYHYGFKMSHIYKIVRTNNRAKAYVALPLTKKKGALKRSVATGTDLHGNPCIYFADPVEGPQRIGSNGLEDLAKGVRETWNRLNRNATLPCWTIFYPEKKQVWFYIALDSADVPSHRLVLHVNYATRDESGVVRGWSLHDGVAAQALSGALYAENVPSTPQSLRVKPWLGFASTVASGEARIQQADYGQTDNGTPYRAYQRTGALVLGGLLQRNGVQNGALLAAPESGASVNVKLIRDFGKESVSKNASLTATGSEARVVALLDSLSMADLFALQIEMGDTAVSSGTFALDQVSLMMDREERA